VTITLTKTKRAPPTASTTPRWIGEFIVIVAGVTVALASDSLWNRWQNSKAERAYVQQLRDELDENAERLNAAIMLERGQRAAAAAAFQAVARGEPIPHDSAVAWASTRRGIHYSDPRLLTGTVAALISTGDLRLLRDPVLRQAIAAYATQIHEDRAEFDRSLSIHFSSFESLRSAVFRGNSTRIDPELPFSSAVAALSGTPGKEVLFAVDGILAANDIRVTYLSRMLETNGRLRALLPAR
jgi:hypothetical protein